MKMLVNNPARSTTRRRRRKRARTAKQKAATRRMIAARKAKLAGTVALNPRRRQAAMARRRRGARRRRSGGKATRTRAATVRWTVNPRRRRRRVARFRRNPGVRNIFGTLVEGVKSGVAVTGGRFAVGYGNSVLGDVIPAIDSLSPEMNKALRETIVALAGTLLLGQVKGPFGRYVPMIAGGMWSRPMETAIRSANIEVVNTGLSSYVQGPRIVPGISSYPANALPYGTPGGAGSYPNRLRAALSGDPKRQPTTFA